VAAGRDEATEQEAEQRERLEDDGEERGSDRTVYDGEEGQAGAAAVKPGVGKAAEGEEEATKEVSSLLPTFAADRTLTSRSHTARKPSCERAGGSDELHVRFPRLPHPFPPFPTSY
jgi:hypothetical protein